MPCSCMCHVLCSSCVFLYVFFSSPFLIFHFVFYYWCYYFMYSVCFAKIGNSTIFCLPEVSSVWYVIFRDIFPIIFLEFWVESGDCFKIIIPPLILLVIFGDFFLVRVLLCLERIVIRLLNSWEFFYYIFFIII